MVALQGYNHDRHYVKALYAKLTPEQQRVFIEKIGSLDSLTEQGILRAKLTLEDVLDLSGITGIILDEVRELRQQQSRNYVAMFTADMAALLGKYFVWDSSQITAEQLASFVYNDVRQLLGLLEQVKQQKE